LGIAKSIGRRGACNPLARKRRITCWKNTDPALNGNVS